MKLKLVATTIVMTALLAWLGDAGLYLHRATAPSSEPVHHDLVAFDVDPSWIKAGSPTFRAAEVSRSPGGRQVVGIWACDGPTTFEWSFALDETVHLLEGEIDVQYLGSRFKLRPGNTATFHAGTKAVWTIPEKAKKLFKLEHPGKLVLLWRKLFPSSLS